MLTSTNGLNPGQPNQRKQQSHATMELLQKLLVGPVGLGFYRSSVRATSSYSFHTPSNFGQCKRPRIQMLPHSIAKIPTRHDTKWKYNIYDRRASAIYQPSNNQLSS